MTLPWGGPRVDRAARLPYGGRERPAKGTAAGNDMFLAMCGLMSTGVRTILISRWRTGGQTSFDLVREFAQELPHSPPADCLAAGGATADANSRWKWTPSRD